MILFLLVATAATVSKIESDRKKESTFASATPKSRMLMSTRRKS